mmetsp:Transcript_124210/g.322650  ORF Transcript_124210/g.322650 Transcript_124210/m.322650 type:complete len:208 (-) Transcript_124210:259-882(-)
MSLAATFGALFCTNSKSAPVPRSAYFERASRVSADVAKEFININFKFVLNSFFIDATCLAIKSRKLLPSVTVNNDFALSNPMPVPRPPFSFKITVFFRSLGSGLILSFSNSWRPSTESSRLSGIMTSAPEARTPRLYLKAAMAASLQPSFSIFSLYDGHSVCNFEGPTVLMISIKEGFKEAPPTKKPSMFGLAMRSLQLSGVTLPPY